MMSNTRPFDFISVVVPTYNRCHLLSDCLRSLNEQTIGTSSYEVIVVDDGSIDDTPVVIEEFSRSSKVNLINLRQKNRGPAAARNLGIKSAAGQLVAFTDDDCEVTPDWLKRLVEGFTDEKVGGVGGIGKQKTSGNINDYLYYEKILEPGVMNGKVLYLVTANACYRKKILEEVGGFDERIRFPGGEDPDLSLKILERGYQLRRNPECIVYHQYPEKLQGMFRMFYNYGRGRHLIHLKWGETYFKRPEIKLFSHLICLQRVIRKLICYRASGVDPKKAAIFAFLWWFEQIAFAAGYRRGY